MLEIDEEKRFLALKINLLYLIFRHYASVKNREIKKTLDSNTIQRFFLPYS